MKARRQGRRSTTEIVFSLGLPPGSLRGTVLALLLAFFSAPALSVEPGSGDPNETYYFDIESGEAAYRLNDFSTQSGLQVLYGFEQMRNVPVTPVRGEFKPFDALDRMLKGTGITYEFVNKRTVTLRRAPPHGSSTVDLRASNKKDRRAITKDRRTLDSIAEEEVLIQSDPLSALESTGSSPLTLNRMEIDALGVATVEGVLRTLPQVFGGGPTEDTKLGIEAGSNTASGTGVNLRGLGASATLILMNGRRLTAGGGEGRFVDISNLPLAAVERMEILPDNSSTYYGADAVGGVVNFVMRNRFEGTQSEAYIGTGMEGELGENHFSQIVGTQTERAHGMVAFDFYSRDALPSSARRQARSDLTAFGGSNFDLPSSNPGTILSGTQTWAVPRDQDGTSLESSDFQPGTSNLRGIWEGVDLLPSQQRESLFGTGEWRLNDRVKLFGDVLFGQRKTRSVNGAQSFPLLVPDTNPYYVNPTPNRGPVTVAYNLFEDLGSPISDVRVRHADATSGFVLEAAGWNVTGSLGYGSERLRFDFKNTVDLAALGRALAESDPAKAFNPFGDGSHNSEEVLAPLRADGLFTTESSITSGSVIASRGVAELPGGSIGISLGADAREQHFESFTRVPGEPDPIEHDLSRSIRSAFAEVRVPVIGPANRRPGVESLEFSVAERYERYSDFGDTLALRSGLSWVPVRGMTLRGTYSESFRPPGLIDLDEGGNAYVIVPIKDTQTGSLNNVLVWTGKNRDLQEETARSWTAGVELESASLPSTALAITYFDTRFVNRLYEPPPTSIAAMFSDPTLTTRDPSAEYQSDVCSRAPQTLSVLDCLSPVDAIVDARTRNGAVVRTRGFDVLGRYSKYSSLGRFSLGFNGTYILDFSEADTINGPLLNKVSTPHYPVNLRLRTAASWQRGPTEITASVNYVNSYLDTLSMPRRHVESWTTLNLRAAFTLQAGGQWLADTSILLGVDNVLDTPPPFVNNGTIRIGYDQENGDLSGRIVSLRVRKKW